MKRLFAIFAVFAVVALSGCKKDDPTIVDEDPQIEVGEIIEFSDNNFKLALIANGFDTNRDGEISAEEALEVDEIVVTGQKIKSLDGLEYFENLLVLQCSDTYLTEIDPFTNTKLTEVVCNDTEVTILDVSACPSLEKLYANTVTALYVKDDKQEDAISALKSKNLATGFQYIIGSEIYDFSDENFVAALLHEKNNVDLNGDDKLSLGEIRMAKVVDISPKNGAAKSFTESILPEATRAAGDQNIGLGSVKIADLSQFAALTKFVSDNNPNLSYVDLSNNSKISEVSMNDVSVVVLSEDQFSNEKLRSAVSQGVTPSTKVVSVAEEVDIENEAILTYIKSYNEGKYDKNNDARLSYSEAALVKSLELKDDAEILAEEVSSALLYLPALETLTLEGCTALEVGVVTSNNPCLNELTITGSPNITDVALSTNTDLEYINLSSTGLTAANTSALLELKKINVSDTPIAALSLARNTMLEEITFDNCALSTFAVGGITAELFEESYATLEESSLATLSLLGAANISDLPSEYELKVSHFTALSMVAATQPTSFLVSQWQADNNITDWVVGSEAKPILDLDQPMNCADKIFESFAVGTYDVCDTNREKNKDSKVTPYEATLAKELHFTSDAAGSFAGTSIAELRYFCNVTDLSVKGHKTYTARPQFDMKPYSELTKLNISDTSVDSLDVTGTTKLIELNCDVEAITALDVSTNPDLKTLSATYVDSLVVSQGQYDGLELPTWKLADGAKVVMADLTPEDALKFSSEAFGAYLLAQDGADADADGSISVAEAAAVTTINLFEIEGKADITKLAELKYFTALETLDLTGFAALSPLEISENKALTSVVIDGCAAITSLDVASNVSLAKLSMTGCDKITKLNITYNPLLTSISAPSVTELSLTDVQYALIGTEAVDWTFSEDVLYTVNEVKYENVAFFEDAAQTEAYVAKLIELNEGLDASGDGIVMESEVAAYAGTLTTIASFTYGEENTEVKLTEIPALAQFTMISGLVVENEAIETLDLSANTALVSLNLTGCTAITTMDLSMLPLLAEVTVPEVTALSVTAAQYEASSSWITNELVIFTVDGLELKSVPFYEDLTDNKAYVAKLLELNPTLDANGDTFILADEVAAYAETLKLTDFEYTAIPLLSDFVLLSGLEVNNLTITSLNLSANTALASLVVVDCDGIESVDLSANTLLTAVTLTGTSISELDLSALPSLVMSSVVAENLMSLTISQAQADADVDLALSKAMLKSEDGTPIVGAYVYLTGGSLLYPAADQVVEIADAAVSAAIVGTYDANEDGAISVEESLKVTSVSIETEESAAISFADLENFVNVTSLSIDAANATTTLDIPANIATELTTLTVKMPQLTTLDLTALTSLANLTISGSTGLAGLPKLLPAATLSTLILDDMLFSTLDVSETLGVLPAAENFSANKVETLTISAAQREAIETLSAYGEKLLVAKSTKIRVVGEEQQAWPIPIYNAETKTITIEVDSKSNLADYEVDGSGVPTEGDLMAQINDDAVAKAAYEGGVIDKIIMSGVVNQADFEALVNHFRVVDMRDVTASSGKYYRKDAATTQSDGLPEPPFLILEGDNTIEEFTLSSKVVSFGNKSMSGAKVLKKVTFPGDDLTTLGYGLFMDCKALEEVIIENDLKVVQMLGDVFSGCSSLNSFTIPETVYAIKATVFKGTALTSIKIPAAVTALVNSAFNTASNLKAIEVGWSVDQIPSTFTSKYFPSGFYTADSGCNVYVPNAVDTYASNAEFAKLNLIQGSMPVVAVTTDIYDSATGTLTVVLDSDTNSASYATTDLGDGKAVPTEGDLIAQINADTKGAKIAYESGVIDNLVISGVMNQGDFNTIHNKFVSVNMRGITKVTGFYKSEAAKATTGTTVSPPFQAFYDNTVMEELVLSASTKTFGNQAVTKATALKKVTIPGTVLTTLGYALFMDCAALEEVIIEDAPLLNKFAGAVFQNCTSLKSLDIPATVVNFVNVTPMKTATGLEHITVHWAADSIPSALTTDHFPATFLSGSTSKFYVPSAELEGYKAHAVFKSFNLEAIAE